MRRLRAKLTYANVMVTLLAFVVLGGGTAVAVGGLGKNSVGARQLKPGSVTSAKVRDGSLRPRDFRGGAAAVTGPAGPAGPSGAGPGFQASGSVNYDELSSNPFGSTVVTLAVPPGNYFATSSLSAESVNTIGTTVQCRLINGVGGSGSAAVRRSQTVRPVASGNDDLTLTGLFAVSSGQTLNLQCSKDDPASGARINDANIVAVQVSSISGFPG